MSAAGGAGARAPSAGAAAFAGALDAAMSGKEVKGGIAVNMHRAAIKDIDAKIDVLNKELTMLMAVKAGHMLVLREADERVEERKSREAIEVIYEKDKDWLTIGRFLQTIGNPRSFLRTSFEYYKVYEIPLSKMPEEARDAVKRTAGMMVELSAMAGTKKDGFADITSIVPSESSGRLEIKIHPGRDDSPRFYATVFDDIFNEIKRGLLSEGNPSKTKYYKTPTAEKAIVVDGYKFIIVEGYGGPEYIVPATDAALTKRSKSSSTDALAILDKDDIPDMEVKYFGTLIDDKRMTKEKLQRMLPFKRTRIDYDNIRNRIVMSEYVRLPSND